jgi:hypothetical protein
MKKLYVWIISVVLILVGLGLVTTSFILNQDNPDEYSWATDPNRLDFPESVSNVTLIVYYGDNNGTTDVFEGINLTDHYTTVFDLVNITCKIEFRIWWLNEPTFYIDSINFLSVAPPEGWTYTINGDFALGANTVSPPNNSVVRWVYPR